MFTNQKSRAGHLKLDGSLKLSIGFQGTLDLRDREASLDNQHGSLQDLGYIARCSLGADYLPMVVKR